MGTTCGTLNVHQSAVVKTWTDREIRHGPSGCFCYNPCTSSVDIIPVTTLKVHEYAEVEDTRDPSQSKIIYGQPGTIHALSNCLPHASVRSDIRMR